MKPPMNAHANSTKPHKSCQTGRMLLEAICCLVEFETQIIFVEGGGAPPPPPPVPKASNCE